MVADFEVLLAEHPEINPLGLDDLTPSTKLDGIMTIAHSPVDGALLDSVSPHPKHQLEAICLLPARRVCGWGSILTGCV